MGAGAGHRERVGLDGCGRRAESGEKARLGEPRKGGATDPASGSAHPRGGTRLAAASPPAQQDCIYSVNRGTLFLLGSLLSFSSCKRGTVLRLSGLLSLGVCRGPLCGSWGLRRGPRLVPALGTESSPRKPELPPERKEGTGRDPSGGPGFCLTSVSDLEPPAAFLLKDICRVRREVLYPAHPAPICSLAKGG